MLVSSALRVTSQDGNKYLFNWHQNTSARDLVFKKLLELLDKIGSPPVVKDETPATPTTTSPTKQEEDEEPGSQLNLNFGRFSRFED